MSSKRKPCGVSMSAFLIIPAILTGLPLALEIFWRLCDGGWIFIFSFSAVDYLIRVKSESSLVRFYSRFWHLKMKLNEQQLHPSKKFADSFKLLELLQTFAKCPIIIHVLHSDLNAWREGNWLQPKNFPFVFKTETCDWSLTFAEIVNSMLAINSKYL